MLTNQGLETELARLELEKERAIRSLAVLIVSYGNQDAVVKAMETSLERIRNRISLFSRLRLMHYKARHAFFLQATK